jgi:multiple sugar transport system ATP-binding protein
MASVTLRRLSKVFDGGVQALPAGPRGARRAALLGPYRSGKTTILRCIAGLEEPTSGDVVIGERVATQLSPTERDVAMVFQTPALYPHLTVRDNIAFPLEVRHIAAAQVARRVLEAATRLGLKDVLDRMPEQLSEGERQRVAMGRAIVRGPQAFLLDEPLSRLDAKLRIELRAELLALHRALGATMIYVTHDQTEAMTIGQRIAVLHEAAAASRHARRGLPAPDGNVAALSERRDERPGRTRQGDGERSSKRGVSISIELMTYEGELQVGIRPST